MFYKNIRHLFILFLIKELTFEVFVSGKPVDDQEKKMEAQLSDQLRFLADNVCLALETETGAAIHGCLENFQRSPLPSTSSSSLEQSSVKIRCRSKYTAVFQIAPSHHWQLVVLVPQQDNETEFDMFSLNHALVKPSHEYEEISTSPMNNYTLWSTELVDGVPDRWRGGDTVYPLDVTSMPAHKDYAVKVNFSRADVKYELFVNALVSWNTSGDADACFDVVNSCDKGDMTPVKVWPNSKPEMMFRNLSAGVSCNVLLVGLYGTTNFNYNTPPCEYYNDCVPATPVVPENLFVEATPESDETWEVRVWWSAPRNAIERYNITLHVDEDYTQEVPGNENEVVFKGVNGEGLYYVKMYAILGHKAAVTSRRAIFPPVQTEDAEGADGAGVAGAAGGGAGGAGRGAALALCGAGAAAALALAWLCRRRRRTAAPTDYLPEDKPAKKSDMEAVSMIVESEDSWEVRSDKLLLHEVIGEGAFGVVRRATLAPSGTNVAVKMLKDFPSLEEIRSFRSEMELMKSVGVHPHLVSLVGCCSGRRPLIIAEYCSRGDLLTYLRCTWDVMVSKRNAKYYNNNIDISDYRNDLFKCKIQTENSKLVVNKLYELQDICDKELTSLDLLSFCRQIAMGMEFLAANRVVHRDLAARNILVTGDRTLKIADFGLSRDVYEENQYKQKGNGKMPVKWMALESLTRRIYTTQSDVWSFGVVVWEVATVGAAPYAAVPAARLPRLLRAGYRMPRPANCSPQLYDIMLSCWRTHPRERPTFAELHSRLDELLNSASAHHYLSLEIEPVDAPPTPKHHRYIKMFMRGKRNWSRGENYERPVKPPQSNYYTSPPVVLSKAPPV